MTASSERLRLVRVMKMQNKLMTRDEAAEYLAVSSSTLARWTSMRVGPRCYKILGSARYRRADLDEYIDSSLVEPVADHHRRHR